MTLDLDTHLRQETFYVAQRAINRDVVEVFVLRYTWARAESWDDEPRLIRAEHLCGGPPFGWDWREHDEGTVMEPALSIPGPLAFLLRSTNPYDVHGASVAVEELIAKVLGGRRG